MIIIDNAGYQFIDSANESEKFLKNNINLKPGCFSCRKKDFNDADYEAWSVFVNVYAVLP